ncbi:MAG: DUF2335 domain-containing protein [Flavobacterium sp.]|nr:DUF2335 domain-containing protein [Flavobacterium sp.]
MAEIQIPDDDALKGNEQEIEKSESEGVIPEDVKFIIKDLPEPQQKAVMAISVLMKKETFRSPLPPPDFLIGYNEALPNGADRIVSLIEQQSRHRMERERTVMDEEIRQSKSGQLYGFIIAMAFLIVSGFLIYSGHDVSGTIIGTIDLVALVGVFALGKLTKKEDDK